MFTPSTTRPSRSAAAAIWYRFRTLLASPFAGALLGWASVPGLFAGPNEGQSDARPGLRDPTKDDRRPLLRPPHARQKRSGCVKRVDEPLLPTLAGPRLASRGERLVDRLVTRTASACLGAVAGGLPLRGARRQRDGSFAAGGTPASNADSPRPLVALLPARSAGVACPVGPPRSYETGNEKTLGHLPLF